MTDTGLIDANFLIGVGVAMIVFANPFATWRDA